MQPVEIDVSQLPAPEPFQRIFESLLGLAPDQYLIAHHRKLPLLLYKPLQQQGYCFHVQSGSIAAYEIIIWRKSQPTPDRVTGPNLAKAPDDGCASPGDH